jgi:hypothetical protein
MSEIFDNKQVKNSFSDSVTTFIGSGLPGGNAPDFTISSNQDFWEDDGFSLTGNPYAPSDDKVVFSSYNVASNTNTEDIFNPKMKVSSMPWNASIASATSNVNIDNQNGFWKYKEDETLRAVESYLASTYHSHYTSEESKTQTLDLIESIGDAEPFTRSNAIKYLSRFGKKSGKSKTDILKAIHYCILLYYFAGLHKKVITDYPY